jgi:gluconolactonase
MVRHDASAKPAGVPVGHVQLPERCANRTFGGGFRNRLLMTASKSLYGLCVKTRGATIA